MAEYRPSAASKVWKAVPKYFLLALAKERRGDVLHCDSVHRGTKGEARAVVAKLARTIVVSMVAGE